MKILAVDTAATSCSVAIIDEQCLLAESVCTDGRTHSVNLMNLVSNLFDQCALAPKDLDGFGVVIGPGTFTGLRIGISTVKGMAYGVDKPVVGINSLDALVFPFKTALRPIVPMLDARRGEVYYACYDFTGNQTSADISYNVAPPWRVIDKIPLNAILIGSGATAYSELFKRELRTVKIEESDNYNLIRASSVAFLAAERFSNGDADEVEELLPYYIRKPDAQINSI